MDLIASFSGKKVRKAYFFNIYGLFGQKVMPFLFDTGAARSVVGTRSFFSALLGSAYTDDCAYSHSIGGNLTITAMKDNAGNECYKDVKSLEFRTVVERYQKELKIAV